MTESRNITLTDTDLRNIKWINRNGVGIQVMETLAVGAFLTAFALELGASNLIIGVLAAIPHLCQLAQIPAVLVLDKVRSRRRVYSVSGWIARPMMLVIGFAAFLPAEQALPVIVVAFTIRYLAGAFLSCSWNSWMRDLIPDEAMGEVFGRRQQIMIGVGIVLTLIAAAFVDSWSAVVNQPQKYAFSVVYCLSFVGGIYAMMAARKIDDPPMPPVSEGDLNLLEQLTQPFRDTNFRRLIMFLGSWNFAVNLAAPFFTVHMLKKMGLDIFTVMLFATMSQAIAYITVSQWGNLADRFSNKAVLRACAPLFVLCIFLWTFTTMPDVHGMTIPLLVFIHIATGAASAGVTLASGNLTLKLAPRGSATGYLSASSIVNAAAAGTASMIGGLTADFFDAIELSLILRWSAPNDITDLSALSLTHWDFFFMSATLFGLYSLHRLSLVEEHGHISDTRALSLLAQNAKQSLRNLSTISGLRAASDFPIVELVRRWRRPDKDATSSEANKEIPERTDQQPRDSD